MEIIERKIIKDSSVARSLVQIVDDRIIINEDELDLFSYFDKSLIPEWQPEINPKPYSELRRIFFDIETDGGLVTDAYGKTRFDGSILDTLQKYYYENLYNLRDYDFNLAAKNAFKALWYREPTNKDSFIVKQINRFFRAIHSDGEVVSDLDLMLLDYGLNAHQHSIALIGLVGATNKSFIIINCREENVSKEEVKRLLSNNDEVKEEYLEKVFIYNCRDEKAGLEKFIALLKKIEPEVLSGFNCFKFDLPFIIKRCEENQIKHPFYVKYKTKDGQPHKTCHKSAQRFGSPQTYHGIWFNFGYKSDKECLIIDLYNQVLAWDFVARKLTSYSLKQTLLQTGLRKTQRTELKFEQMLECLEKGELNSLSEYLFYDLEDTMMLGDFLIPSIYYQKLFLPDWKLQSISHSGNGSKWNDILKKIFLKQKITPEILEIFDSIGCEIGQDNLPKTERKYRFVGGLVGANKGVYLNVSKIDVASLYPSIMLAYGIQSQKDFAYNQLAILKYLLEWRLRLKAKKKDGNATNEEIRTEAAFKVIINSSYGALATIGINFNDYVAAALVTAYGRKILKLMIHIIMQNGGIIVSCFTGDTLVLTDKGDMPMIDLIGKKIKVLNGDREWKEVEFKSYGYDKIYHLTLKRNREIKTISCTGNHKWLNISNREWYLKGNKDNWKIVETKDLKPKSIIPYQLPHKPEENTDYYNGIVHGIVYGDGTKSPDFQKYYISLYKEKMELSEYFYKGDSVKIVSDRFESHHDVECKRLRISSNIDLKELPSLESNNSYLLGFVRGLISTDGNVSNKDGVVDISGEKETCEYIEKISPRIGLNPSRINISQKAGRETIIRGVVCKQRKDNYRIFFSLDSIELPDLLRTFHKSKFKKSEKSSNWTVVSVEETDRYEEVFCCNEPTTHQFTLSNFILTHNCDCDGVYYSTIDSTFELNDLIYKKCQEGMPEGINLDYELEAKMFFVPPMEAKKFKKMMSDSDGFSEGIINDGLKKNYIIIGWKTPKGERIDREKNPLVVKSKGRFVKRDRCKFEKDYQLNLMMQLAIMSDIDRAKKWHQENIEALRNGLWDIEDLKITRKIRKGEKKMCQYGEQGEVISYYRGIDTVTYHKKTGKPNKKRIENWVIEGEIGWEFYIGLAEKLASEIFDNYVTEVDNNFEVEELVENE